MIFVTDNLIENSIKKSLEEEFSNFLWRYGNTAVPEGEPFFGRVIYHKETPESNLEISKNLQILIDSGKSFLENNLKNVRSIELHRILANGQLPSQDAGIHIDWHDHTMATMVYYLSNSEGGGTAFFNDDNHQIEFTNYLQGRSVFFPSMLRHQGVKPDRGWRISLGIMFKLGI